MVMKERKRTGFWSSILYGSMYRPIYRPAMLPRISFQKRSEEIYGVAMAAAGVAVAQEHEEEVVDTP
jgi:hypothetical protein